MKAEELMIDDWVKIANVETNIPSYIGARVKVCEVYKFDDYEKIKVRVGINTYNVEDGNEIEPIPLTKEILEKNGFKKSDSQDIWTFYTDDYGILWPTDGNNTLAINSYFAEYGIFSKQHIGYVHQLQHALRLCGINKEIKV